MRIAIAASGKDENSQVSDDAEKAPFFLIYENKELVKVMLNPFSVGGKGAGTGITRLLENEGVNLVISQMIEQDMEEALKTAKIKTKVVKDKTVKDILNN
jgi:predicted Fe-Mo cluster-binding NifX family protein